MLLKMAMGFQMIFMNNSLRNGLLYCFQEEFRKTGKDTIDGTTYQMAGDYSNARMNQVILSECNSIDTTEFEKTLEEAEMYLNSKYKN